MNVRSPSSQWSAAWGEDFGDLYMRHQMEHDADFSVSPQEIGPAANLQGYGEPITLATVAAITGIVSAIGGGVATGITMGQRAKERRHARETAKKQRATRKLEMLRASTQQRASESDAAIAESQKKIAAVQAEARAQRGGAIIFPAILALGIFGFIAYKSAQ
jgi:hypothetical protein